MSSKNGSSTFHESKSNAPPTQGSETSGLDRGTKSLIWGLASGFLGVVTILVTILLDEKYHPTTYHAIVLLQFSGHAGIALLLLGIVGIIVEFKNWRDYFEERLANTIKKREFLRTLQRDQLKILLKDVFLAYYKVENSDPHSFLEFFTTKIQHYIGGSFREDTTIVLTVNRSEGGDCCGVKEDLSYKCRKVEAESSTIPEEVSWCIDTSDIVENLKNYQVTLTVPEKWRKSFTPPKGFPDMDESGKIILVHPHEKLDPCSARYGFKLSLEGFGTIDELHVHQVAEYVIRTERFFSKVMKYPSRGYRIIFNYPQEDFTLHVEPFGMDPANLTIIEQPGLYSLTYDSWLLPKNGLAYRLMKKSSSKEDVLELLTDWENSNAPNLGAAPAEATVD